MRPISHLRLVATGIVLLGLAARTPAAAADAPVTPWVPDQGDGTYRNPVLYADYSDPDVIRVGDDFWLTSSSFNHVPGLPILHSRDLVNWELVGHALPKLVPAEHFATVRHGEGVWAPALRFHAGTFYLFYPDPDFGLYVVTTRDPRGAWSAPTLVKAGKGLIDPCPLWDDDGQVYLIHGWARSRGPVANRLSVCRLSPDTLQAVDESVDVVDANQLPGWRTLEGPKWYKRHGYYYIFAPAGGVKEGYQAVFRAKKLYGPYEHRIVLDQGRTAVNGPHQGAWVDTPAGEDWFVHFQDQGPFGRVVHLQPMAWRDDDWPAMGTAVATGATKGEPVLAHAKPKVTRPVTAPVVPAASDAFPEPELGLQWQWQANPQAHWYSLRTEPARLRLHAVPLHGDSLYDAPNLLLQKFVGPKFTATVQLDAKRLGNGSQAGLIVFGYSYAWLGLRRTARGDRLVLRVDHAHDIGFKPGPAGPIVERELPAPATTLWLRVAVDQDAACTFTYSTDGRRFAAVEGAPPFTAAVARWVGAKVGLFATHSDTIDPMLKDHADFMQFEVTP